MKIEEQFPAYQQEQVTVCNSFKEILKILRDDKNKKVKEIIVHDLEGKEQRVFSWDHPEYQQARPFNQNFMVQSKEGYEDDELTGKRGTVLLPAEHPWIALCADYLDFSSSCDILFA
jgi:hypothetical protein